MPLYFNPRSPCGERPLEQGAFRNSRVFQSSLPVWGATTLSRLMISNGSISILAPRVGSDALSEHIRPRFYNFNPRSPCGERLVEREHSETDEIISILAPRVGSDYRQPRKRKCHFISILAPRVGSDNSITIIGKSEKHFNPRSPCGERLLKFETDTCYVEFQSSLPVWGATFHRAPAGMGLRFQSSLPVWGATICFYLSITLSIDFNPRSPCGERRVYSAGYRPR